MTKEKCMEFRWNCGRTSIYFSQVFNFQKQPPEVFCEKGILKNFENFTGKHLC